MGGVKVLRCGTAGGLHRLSLASGRDTVQMLGASGGMLILPIIAPLAEGICPVPYPFVC
jgi:hypothetical protein